MTLTPVVLTNAARAKCFRSLCRSRRSAITHQILNLNCVLSLEPNGDQWNLGSNTNKDLRTATLARSFRRSFIRSFRKSFIRSFRRSFVTSLKRSFIRSFRRSFIRSFARSFRSCTRSFVWSFIRSYIRSFIRSFLRSCGRSKRRMRLAGLIKRPLALPALF